jgi:cellulose biosynthesis protein BcsQ
MLARQGQRVVMIDGDPQCNLTAFVLPEDELIELWDSTGGGGDSVADCLEPVRRRTGDLVPPHVREVAPDLYLLPGDLSFSRFEQTVAADGWSRIDSLDDGAILVTTALARLIEAVGTSVGALFLRWT